MELRTGAQSEQFTDDRDGQSHHQHAGDGTHPTHHLPQGGHGGDVAVAHGGHGDQGPPVRVEHRVELRGRCAVLLEHEGQRGEDQDLVRGVC